ncbi:MAG: type IV toxin-antitoxin system AbiEi family antitoxin domain-containing protein [Acidimicrobiia bacterium]|nr:type IV toxin-antitoxin system AbiEi family antitoxin domain-containing protein [Acidimicrobiia bacterium]
MSRATQKALALRKIRSSQFDLFTRKQAHSAGYSRLAIAERLESGEWIEVHPNVFREGSSLAPTPHQVLMAALLYAGPDAVLAQRSAAFLHGILDELPATVDVYRPRRRGHGIDGIHIPTSTYLHARDVTTVKRMDVTTVDRTVVDTAARHPDLARDVVDLALQRNLTTLENLERCARRMRRRGRPGIPSVLHVLSTTNPAVGETRSIFEARTLAAIGAAGIRAPVPDFEMRVNGQTYFLDFAWPDVHVYLEFDGFDPHAKRRPFVTDRRRQNDLTAAGWLPFHVTAEMLHRPHITFRGLAETIDQRTSV